MLVFGCDGSTCLFVVAAFLFQLYLFKKLDLSSVKAQHAEPPEDAAAATWTPRENEAWKAVLAVADTVDLSHFSSWPAFLGLGKQTIEAVAKSLHPEVKEPVWQFTMMPSRRSTACRSASACF